MQENTSPYQLIKKYICIEKYTICFKKDAIEHNLEEIRLSKVLKKNRNILVIGKFFQTNTTLTSISFAGLKLGNSKVIHVLYSLTNHPSLTHLNLRKNKMTKKSNLALMNFFDQNKALKSLNLSKNKFGHISLVNITKHLKNNKNILKLDLSGNVIYFKTIVKLLKIRNLCKYLEKLKLSYRMPVALDTDYLTYLLLNSDDRRFSIKIFYFDIRVDNLYLKKLAAVMLKIPNLTIAKYSNNVTSLTLDNILEQNIKTNSLITNSQNIYKFNFAPSQDHYKHQVKRLAAFIHTNHTITNLDLSQCFLEEIYLIRIIASLMPYHNLYMLNISSSKLGGNSASLIKEFLKNDKKLKILNIAYNDFSDYDILTIISGLKNNRSLIELNVFNNKKISNKNKICKKIINSNSELLYLNINNANITNRLKPYFQKRLSIVKEYYATILKSQDLSTEPAFKLNARDIHIITTYLDYYIYIGKDLDYNHSTQIDAGIKANFIKVLETLNYYKLNNYFLIYNICQSFPPIAANTKKFSFFAQLPYELTSYIFQYLHVDDIQNPLKKAIKISKYNKDIIKYSSNTIYSYSHYNTFIYS